MRAIVFLKFVLLFVPFSTVQAQISTGEGFVTHNPAPAGNSQANDVGAVIGDNSNVTAPALSLDGPAPAEALLPDPLAVAAQNTQNIVQAPLPPPQKPSDGTWTKSYHERAVQVGALMAQVMAKAAAKKAEMGARSVAALAAQKTNEVKESVAGAVDDAKGAAVLGAAHGLSNAAQLANGVQNVANNAKETVVELVTRRQELEALRLELAKTRQELAAARAQDQRSTPAKQDGMAPAVEQKVAAAEVVAAEAAAQIERDITEAQAQAGAAQTNSDNLQLLSATATGPGAESNKPGFLNKKVVIGAGVAAAAVAAAVAMGGSKDKKNSKKKSRTVASEEQEKPKEVSKTRKSVAAEIKNDSLLSRGR